VSGSNPWFVAHFSKKEEAKRCDQAWEFHLVFDVLSRWPVLQQIKTGDNGTGRAAMSERTRNLQPRTAGSAGSLRIASWVVVN